MPFHRLTAQSYIGGLAGTHDFINDPVANGDAGLPAVANSGKIAISGHPNLGSYMVGFGLDGTSGEANRPHEALAENTDFLDDVVSGQLPVISHVDGVAGASTSTLIITGNVFMGMNGVYANTQDFRDRLISVLDSTTLNEVVDASGVKVQVTAIRDNTNTFNRVGAAVAPGGDFENNPTLTFNPPIPAGTNYRIVFAKRSSLVTALRSGTDRDFAVRTAIRNAHETSAEVLRFMTQASRQTGGNITALSASTIETPRAASAPGGSTLPVANTLNIDIDPTTAFAFNGALNVVFDRDGAPKTLFSILEGSGAGLSEWRNTSERIALSDVNTISSGFAATAVPFSSGTAAQGDDNLRLMEGDPAGAARSLLQAVNGRWSATVGDGVNTFGDWNGTGALNSALNFAIALGVSHMHVRLKPGTYHLNAVNFIGITSITLEGTHEGVCKIENISASGPAFNTTTTGQTLVLKNLRISESGGSQFAIFCSGATRMYLENVVFEDTTFRYTSTADDTLIHSELLYFKNCRWEMSSTGRVGFELRAGIVLSDVQGILFEDCYFIPPPADTPAVRLSELGASAGSILRRIAFTRCVFDLGSTTDNGLGDLQGNSGVFDVGSITNSNLTVGDITWTDCYVRVRSPSSAVQVLLYLRAGDSANTINFNTVRIDGGRWELQDANSAITSFYIGGEEYDDAGINEIDIRDVEWGIDDPAASRDYGSSPTELNFGGGDDEWAQFVLSADKITARNVKWMGCTARGRCGQAYLRCRVWDIDGLKLNQTWVDTAQLGAAPPRHQVHFEQTATSLASGTIRNVHVEAFPAVTNLAGFFGIVWTTPNGWMQLEDCYVTGFTNVSNAGIGQFGSASGQHGLRLLNCFVENCGVGYQYSYTTGDQALDDMLISGCRFKNCGTNGVRISATGTGPAPLNIIIEACHFDGNAGVGIHIAPGAAYSGSNPGIILKGNSFFDNNGASSNDQVFLGQPGGIQGAAYGNMAANSGSGMGVMHFDAAVPNNFHGSETGYDSSGASIAFVGQRLHANLALMLHNNMRYDGS